MKKYHFNSLNIKQKGSALSLVIIMMMVVMVLITGIMTLTVANQKVGIADKDYAAIYYETEGVLSYELTIIEQEIQEIYNNHDTQLEFENAVKEYFETYGNDYNSDEEFNISHMTVELEAGEVTDESDSIVVPIIAYGKKNVLEDSLATRETNLQANLTITWQEKPTGGESGLFSELRTVPVWIGNYANLTTNARIGNQSEPINIAFLSEDDDIIKGWNVEKIYGDIYIPSGKDKSDIKEMNSPGALEGNLYKNQTIVEYEAIEFPANTAEFYEIIEGNDGSGTEAIINCTGSETDITIPETHGDISVNLNNGSSHVVRIEHENGGEFNYSQIIVNIGDELTIYSDEDLEIYCDKIEIYNGGKVLFDGDGQINIYVTNLSISGDSLLGRENIPIDGLADFVFTENYLGVSSSVQINANVFANGNVGMSSSGKVRGVLIGSDNVARINVHNEAAIYGGVYAPTAYLNVTNYSDNGLISVPVVCNELSMTNQAKIIYDENNIINEESVMKTLGFGDSTNSGTTTDELHIVSTSNIKRVYD